jgi:hypothetical protein
VEEFRKAAQFTTGAGRSGAPEASNREVASLAADASSQPTRVFRRMLPRLESTPPPEVTLTADRSFGRSASKNERALARHGSGPTVTPISPGELNRITDHVIETLDRRITASRERRGMA